MKHLITRLERYGIGLRPQTEADFWRIVEMEGIAVIWTDGEEAFMFTLLGRKFLAIPKRKRGLRRLFAMFHELGHLLLMNGQGPQVAFLDLECSHDTKSEAEANAVALVALIPKHMIQELASEYGETRYGDSLWRDRCRLYFLYGL